MVLLTAIILGFILDFIFGDPRWLPHPICFIGKLISITEKAVRRFCGEKPEGLLMGGFVMVVIVLTVTFAVPYFILTLAEMYSPVLAFAVETFMFYQIFAMRSLKEASLQVYDALKSGDLQEARKKLSWIVGRDTAELTDEEVAKAAVETVAENTSDGVIAPLFFMFIGGAPLAFLYKAINTMDSMVGYKNDKYLYFGRCAAKLDDVANFIPARISGLLMVAAAYFLNMDASGSWRIFKRDRRHHLSPNSAMTESALADLHFDVQQIPLADDSVDVILCNHLLEHVADDRRALHELYRILKPGGWGILLSPVEPDYEQTYEDDSITDPEERTRIFGQYDHRRIYGADYTDRLREAGFEAADIDYAATFSEAERRLYALPKDHIYVVYKH